MQEAIRQILEAIYEPVFSPKSHGFRPKRSCHTALAQVSKEFRGTKWFIEGDIKGCFDNIDHIRLLEILSEKIKDSKFVNLIGKFLKAGYMEDWKYHNTYSGTPQGGIISPILSNIYLNELDHRIEQLKSEFDKPAKQLCSTVYGSLRGKINRLKSKIANSPDNPLHEEWIETVQSMQKQLYKLPYSDTSNKKLVYVRYADDFLIGISGTKEDAIKVKGVLKDWLAENLCLELSDEKTKITHSSEHARFLGYDISVRRNQSVKGGGNRPKQRTLNNSVELTIPLKDKIEPFIFEKKIARQEKCNVFLPVANPKHLNLTDLEIVDTYNAQARGICNYYALASNFSKLSYLCYLMEYSCLKTLAKKHKSSVAKIYGKYRHEATWGIPYETKQGAKVMSFVKLKDCKRVSAFDDLPVCDVDIIKTKYHNTNVNSLDSRLRANTCELCGKKGAQSKYEIHHVNKVKSLKGKTQWEKVMIARRRKTLVVCKECHTKIHQQN